MKSVKMAFLGSYSIIVFSLVLIGTPLVLGLRVRSNLGPPISNSNIFPPFRSAPVAKPSDLPPNQIIRDIILVTKSSYKLTRIITYCVDERFDDTSAIAEEIEENLNHILSQVATIAENVAESLDGGSIDQKILELFVNIIDTMENLESNTMSNLKTDEKTLEKIEASLGRQEKELSRMVRELKSGIQLYEKVLSSDLTNKEAKRIAGAMSIAGDIMQDIGYIVNRSRDEYRLPVPIVSFEKKVLSDFKKIFEDLLDFLQVVMS